MSKILLKFEANFADEFDVYGFAVITKEEWEYKKLELENTPFPQEIYFGTNEACDFDSKEDYLSNFKVYEITDEEYDVLKQLFGSYGSRVDFGDILWIEGEASDSFYEEHRYPIKQE